MAKIEKNYLKKPIYDMVDELVAFLKPSGKRQKDLQRKGGKKYENKRKRRKLNNELV